MKIDTHIHTAISSGCSILSPDELIYFLMEGKVDAICVTEHNTLKGGNVFKSLCREYGFKVYEGMEISNKEGHFLTYNFFEEGDYSEMPIEQLIDLVHNEDGIIVPSHPFRAGFKQLLLPDDIIRKFDAIEVKNGNCSDADNEKSYQLAARLSISVIAGSDAHSKDMLGKYFTFFPYLPADEKELADMIKTGLTTV